MTPQQQRIAIAEACGITVIKTPFTPSLVKAKGCVFTDEARDEWRKAYPNSAGVYRLPDYLNDLNAMHEAEQVLTPKYQPAKGESQWGDYLGWLGFCGENKTREVYECVTATAAQRAKAFLRTLGLWQETPTQPQ